MAVFGRCDSSDNRARAPDAPATLTSRVAAPSSSEDVCGRSSNGVQIEAGQCPAPSTVACSNLGSRRQADPPMARVGVEQNGSLASWKDARLLALADSARSQRAAARAAHHRRPHRHANEIAFSEETLLLLLNVVPAGPALGLLDPKRDAPQVLITCNCYGALLPRSRRNAQTSDATLLINIARAVRRVGSSESIVGSFPTRRLTNRVHVGKRILMI
jgi:hypothetical protein